MKPYEEEKRPKSKLPIQYCKRCSKRGPRLPFVIPVGGIKTTGSRIHKAERFPQGFPHDGGVLQNFKTAIKTLTTASKG